VTWQVVRSSDPRARALRDRHYSTKRPGGLTVGPPGRRLVLVSDDERSLWVTHWPAPELALDGIDALRCTVFRREREGARLGLFVGELDERPSSALVLEAMAVSEAILGPAPAGWLTYVEPGKVAGEVPGYCFRRAGYRHDRGWSHPRLIRLRRSSIR
jgi:hypothetical protein